MNEIDYEFYRNSIRLHAFYSTLGLKEILFPEVEYEVPGDEAFHKLWRKIDSANVGIFKQFFYENQCKITIGLRLAFNLYVQLFIYCPSNYVEND